MNSRLSGILIGVLVFSLSLIPVSGLEREDCGTLIGTPEIAGENHTQSADDTVRVYPLHIGNTLVSYEQFYGGTMELSESALSVLVNSERFFWAPVYMFLVVHPEHGAFIIDTAFNEEMANNYDEYFRGVIGTTSRLMKEEYTLDKVESVPAQLARFGLNPEDIQLVILTHAHDDHVGGLPYFKDARIVVAEDEFAFIEIVSTNRLPINGKYYQDVTCWEPVSFTDEAVGNFERSQDVFGDGSVILLPAPGHTAGSLMVLVDTGDNKLLLTGDTIYTMYHLDPDTALQLIPDTNPDEIREMVLKVVEFSETMPDTYIIPAHDHSEYLETVIPSLMECGTLTTNSQERAEKYLQALFDENGNLPDDLIPQYDANEDGSIYGEVASPDIELSTALDTGDCT